MFFQSSSPVSMTVETKTVHPTKKSIFGKIIENYMKANEEIYNMYEDFETEEESDEEVEEVQEKKIIEKKLNGGFHPKNMRVKESTVAEFIMAPMEESLQSVPGVKTSNEKILKEEGVTTTFQLVGKYLSLKDENVDGVELADRFYYWLQSIGVNAFRATIVGSIGEKASTWMPGVYNSSDYEGDETVIEGDE